jgi:hypothetical protein
LQRIASVTEQLSTEINVTEEHLKSGTLYEKTGLSREKWDEWEPYIIPISLVLFQVASFQDLTHVNILLSFCNTTCCLLQHLNKTYKTSVPLVLMNSFNTDEDTQKIIRKYKGLQVEIYTFNQSCFPRINRESLLPVAKSCNVDADIEA